MNTSTENKKWQLLLHEVKALGAKGAALIHERTLKLIAVEADKEFQSYCTEQSISAIDFLDEHIADTGLDFVTLHSVMKSHPNVDDWKQHGVRKLIAMTIEEQQRESEPTERTNWKKLYQSLEARFQKLEAENEVLRSKLADMATETTTV